MKEIKLLEKKSMININIVNSKNNNLLIPELLDLFNAQWNDLEPLTTEKNGYKVPPPLLALDGTSLIGGLSFTRHPVPKSNNQGLWVNAVYIKPQYRKQGISSNLILEAENIVKLLGESHIYAYTHLPKLYEKLGWNCIELDNDHVVMSKSINYK